MDRMMTRHPLSALWGDMPRDEVMAMRKSVQDHGFTDRVIWTYDGSVLDGWHRYTIANLLNLDLELREYSGDPVPFVIARNRHRRHLTDLQKGSCVSACLDWAKQGQQKNLERDKDTGQFTIGDKLSPMDEPVTKVESGRVNPEEATEPAFFTQQERASLADVDVKTQKRSDRYEKAGLGPKIRSGEISGAEAERRVQEPDTPKPPSRLQQLKIQLEAQVEAIQIKDTEIEEWKQKHEFAVSQSSEYPHEKEATLNQLQAENSALRSSVNEWMTKHNDEKRRAAWFKKQARKGTPVALLATMADSTPYCSDVNEVFR